MARCVLSLLALACLALAFLQLVSAESKDQYEKEVEAVLGNEINHVKLEDLQVNHLTEADAKRKPKRQRRRKNRGKSAKRKSKKAKRKSKGRRKTKKGKRRGNKRKMGGLKPIARQSTCDAKALCQKIKNYIKYSNQLRKLKRINKTCSTMEKKGSKAEGGEFNATAEANADSGDDEVDSLAEELKKCHETAKENCEIKAMPACTNLTLNNKCLIELTTWINKFGPAKGSCLQASADCCACINAISPDPSPDCLNFEKLDNESKVKKKKCTGSESKGSFGYCRKLQQDASHKGPKAHGKKCKGKMTTAAMGKSGRKMNVRSKLRKMMN